MVYGNTSPQETTGGDMLWYHEVLIKRGVAQSVPSNIRRPSIHGRRVLQLMADCLEPEFTGPGVCYSCLFTRSQFP